MEFAITLIIRGGLGIILGIFFGIAGWFFTFWVVLGNYTQPLWLLVNVAAVFAASAAFLAWFKPESGLRITAIGLLLAVVGAFIGGWLGFGYGQVAYPDGVRNPQLVATSLRSPVVMPFITGAALAATGLGSGYYALRLWRYNEA